MTFPGCRAAESFPLRGSWILRAGTERHQYPRVPLTALSFACVFLCDVIDNLDTLRAWTAERWRGRVRTREREDGRGKPGPHEICRFPWNWKLCHSYNSRNIPPCVFVCLIPGLIWLCFQWVLIPSEPEGYLQFTTETALYRFDGFCWIWTPFRHGKPSYNMISATSASSHKPQCPKVSFLTSICNITPVSGQQRRSSFVNDSSRWQGGFDVCLVASEYT